MLAYELRGTFIEGDEHSAPDKPWYVSTLYTARSIVRSIKAAADGGKPVVIAYPLRCIDWIFYRHKLAERDIHTIVVSLGASYDATIASDRGRRFSADERARIRQMIAEGYDRRGFSDFAIRTDRQNQHETLGRLLAQLPNLRPNED